MGLGRASTVADRGCAALYWKTRRGSNMGPAMAAVVAASMASGALFPRNPAPTPPPPFSLIAPTAKNDDAAAVRWRGDEALLRRLTTPGMVPVSPLGDFPLLVDETRVC